MLLLVALEEAALEVLLPLPELGWRLLMLAEIPDELELLALLAELEDRYWVSFVTVIPRSSSSSSFSFFSSCFSMLLGDAEGAKAMTGKASGAAPLGGGPADPRRKEEGGGVLFSRYSALEAAESVMLEPLLIPTLVP